MKTDNIFPIGQNVLVPFSLQFKVYCFRPRISRIFCVQKIFLFFCFFFFFHFSSYLVIFYLRWKVLHRIQEKKFLEIFQPKHRKLETRPTASWQRGKIPTPTSVLIVRLQIFIVITPRLTLIFIYGSNGTIL